MSEKFTNGVGPDNRTDVQFKNDTVSMLSVKVENIHSRRAMLYKVAEDIAERQKSSNEPTSNKSRGKKRLTWLCEQYWTESAWKKYKTNLANHEKNPFTGLHLEHPVPKSMVTNWLCHKNSDLENPVDQAQCFRAIDLFMCTCWVTGGKNFVSVNGEESEQKILDAPYPDEQGNTTKCKDYMPNSPVVWDHMQGDLWARYKFVQMQSNGQLSDWKKRSDHEKCSQQSPAGVEVAGPI